MGNQESQLPGVYREPQLAAGFLEVRISVYKLNFTGMRMVDSIGAGIVGAYHSGLVVNGEEWAYGGHDEVGKSGVYRTKPEFNTDYNFYQRIVVGHGQLRPEEVAKQIRRLGSSKGWSGPSYDLIEHNCNHFVSDLCWVLLKKRPPSWVNETAEMLAATRRRTRAERNYLVQAMSSYEAEHKTDAASKWVVASAEENGDVSNVPGARAFQDTFRSTFDMALRRAEANYWEIIKACPEGQDPEELRWNLEAEALARADMAARMAAASVALAARTALAARCQQPASGQPAWDKVWSRHSAPMLREWREAALAGKLQEADAPLRLQQVQAALAAAAAASAAATEAALVVTAVEASAAAPPVFRGEAQK
mmetsp:Transcript_60890/g.133887  ORF Transcript_60890/g.133887 Transcript_60890/m.133887 type:complete len:365 (+) Transcript_60890:87-1181(+)